MEPRSQGMRVELRRIGEGPLDPEESGAERGLAMEAASRVCDHAFSELGFDRIEAAMDSPNRASMAVAERLGMSLLDTTVQGSDGTVFYEIERDRWRKGSA